MEILRQIVAIIVADATHPDSTGWQSFGLTLGITFLMGVAQWTGLAELYFAYVLGRH